MSAGTLTNKLTRALKAAVADKAAELDLRQLLTQVRGRAAGATITVGAESTNVRAITIQLTDEKGTDLAVRGAGLIFVLADANGDAFATTGGSTGIAIGTDGALLDVVAKKAFAFITEADGDLDLTWTDTGTETVAIAVLLPNGTLVISDAFANA